MNVQLIAMDLDGTALQPDHKTVTLRLLQALEKAYQKGIRIVPVTGRPMRMIPPFIQIHPVWEEYFILSNGSQIRNNKTGEVIQDLGLGTEELTALVELGERYHIPVELSTEKNLYVTHEDMERQQGVPGMEFHCDVILEHNGVFVDSLFPFCRQKEEVIEKLNFNCVPENVKKILTAETNMYPVTAVWTGDSYMEITHRNATKGNALRKLCSILKIPMENVLAMGDSGNDVSMLQAAGLGVAMKNAPDYVQRAADVVSKANTDDGAALAIEKFAL